MSFETISVIGLGYIGLPTAAMFAAHGKNVIGVDVNQEAVDTINDGKIHIVEPGLDAIVFKAVSTKKLKASLTPLPADAFLIAVPTPFMGNEHQPDLRYIEAAAKTIAPVLKKGNLVILESTSPVGTTEKMADWLSEIRPDLSFPRTKGVLSDIRIAHCPERVLPGQVVRELVENDRVIGGLTEKCSEMAIQLYKIFVRGDCIVTNARTAEMAKLTENASRDVSIAFANELSIICDELDINVWELIRLANRHPRVNILNPGPGVGGHCIAVDPWFIVSETPQQSKLIHTARIVNDGKPGWVLDKVKRGIYEHLASNPHKAMADITIACFGVAFKADIDDVRESPALHIALSLSKQEFKKLLVVEPNVLELPDGFSDKSELVSTETALLDADVLVILVGHKEFQGLVIAKDKIVIDTIGLT